VERDDCDCARARSDDAKKVKKMRADFMNHLGDESCESYTSHFGRRCSKWLVQQESNRNSKTGKGVAA
jgi:hypothetical protein